MLLQDYVGRFATLTGDVEMRRFELPPGGGAAVAVLFTAPAGATVRIVSFFLDHPDLGVTDQLDDHAHRCRVRPEALAHLRFTPDAAPARAQCDAHNGEGLIQMRCKQCGRRQCDECTMDDELLSGLCFYCQPKGGAR